MGSNTSKHRHRGHSEQHVHYQTDHFPSHSTSRVHNIVQSSIHHGNLANGTHTQNGKEPIPNVQSTCQSCPVNGSHRSHFEHDENSEQQHNCHSVVDHPCHLRDDDHCQTCHNDVNCKHSDNIQTDHEIDDTLSQMDNFPFANTPFIFSTTIPYSITIPEFCNIRIDEPFVTISPNHLLDAPEYDTAQIVVQVVAHYARDCMELALKEWPHAHWERTYLPKSNSPTHDSSNAWHDTQDHNSSYANLEACRTMHTIQALRITTKFHDDYIYSGSDQPSASTSVRYVLNPNQNLNQVYQQEQERSMEPNLGAASHNATKAPSISNYHVHKDIVWVRLTIWVVDGKDGLFYWFTGINEAESPRQLTVRRNFLSRQRISFIKNQVSVYDHRLLDPMASVLFDNDYEFPKWEECRWSSPYSIDGYDMDMRIPPMWRVRDRFYIVSPVQTMTGNWIQEHFFFSMVDQARSSDDVYRCCESIVQKNQSLHPKVQVVSAGQKIFINGQEGLYSVFRTSAPPNSPYPCIEKIVINLRAAESDKQWVFSYISSYGFRSMNLWKRFLRGIRIGHFSAGFCRVDDESNNSQNLFAEVASPRNKLPSTDWSKGDEDAMVDENSMGR